MMLSKFAPAPGTARGLRLAAATAVAAFVGWAPAAHAAVVVSPVVNLVIPATTAGLYINVITGTATATTAGSPGWDINPWSSTGLQLWAPATGGGIVTNGTAIASLPVGTVVGPASTFAAQGTAATAANGWLLNSTNYFGFRFVNEATGATHYGYGAYAVGSAFNAPNRTILNLFYESTPDTAITVVPEPGTYALMSLGLAAVAFAARRRKAD